jgi:hypothetical protein
MNILANMASIASEKETQIVKRVEAPTLVPDQNETGATRGTTTLPDASKPDWFSNLVRLLDKPIHLVANLTSFGFVGIVLASIIQYSSWRDEKQGTRHKEELSSAISTFQEISGTLSGAMNLQQILFYTYKNALNPDDEHHLKYLATSGQKILTEYTEARTALRKSIDVLTGKADLFIYRPTRSESKRLTSPNQFTSDRVQVSSNRQLLKGIGFSCEKDLPRQNPIKFGEIEIDWIQTTNHVATFYYCFDELHYSIFPARKWALQALLRDEPRAAVNENHDAVRQLGPIPKEKMDEIETCLGLETRRLNDFITLSTNKIEEMRLRTRDNGFLHRQFCFFCGD